MELHLIDAGDNLEINNQGVCEKPPTMRALTAHWDKGPRRPFYSKQNVIVCGLGICSHCEPVSSTLKRTAEETTSI